MLMNPNNRRSFLKSAGVALSGVFGLPNLSMAVQQATSPYQRPKLKITDVKTAYLQNFHVRIYTDQGLTGDGEAVDAISGAGPIVVGFRFLLMNQDPLNVEAIWERIRTSGIFSGAQGGPIRDGAYGGGNRPLGPGGQSGRAAHLPTDGRQDARPHPRLHRLRHRQSQ